jgi:transglutaminase-like putative cysteine protease
MTSLNDDYLQPSKLCDFDRRPELRAKALELASGCRSDRERFQRIYRYVKELSYVLEDWDTPASQTLARKRGMCSGKANLMVALLRSLGIRCRYRVYRIRAEAKLWRSIVEDRVLGDLMGSAPEAQDHVDCEVWLDGWTPCDPARDTALERGLAAMGMPLERQTIPDERTGAAYACFARFDEWALERQRRRRIRDHRGSTFEKVNSIFDRIRALGTNGSSLPIG